MSSVGWVGSTAQSSILLYRGSHLTSNPRSLVLCPDATFPEPVWLFFVLALASLDVLGEDARGSPVRDPAVLRQGPGAVTVSRRVLQVPLHRHGRQRLPCGDRRQYLILVKKSAAVCTVSLQKLSEVPFSCGEDRLQ